MLKTTEPTIFYCCKTRVFELSKLNYDQIYSEQTKYLQQNRVILNSYTSYPWIT